MSIASQSKLYTADEAKSIDDAVAYDLVDGELKERGMGAEASWIEAKLLRVLGEFADRSGILWIFGSSVALHLFPQRDRYYRRADGSAVLRSRFPGERLPREDSISHPTLRRRSFRLTTELMTWTVNSTITSPQA